MERLRNISTRTGKDAIEISNGIFWAAGATRLGSDHNPASQLPRQAANQPGLVSNRGLEGAASSSGQLGSIVPPPILRSTHTGFLAQSGCLPYQRHDPSRGRHSPGPHSPRPLLVRFTQPAPFRVPSLPARLPARSTLRRVSRGILCSAFQEMFADHNPLAFPLIIPFTSVLLLVKLYHRLWRPHLAMVASRRSRCFRPLPNLCGAC